jgi:hypothetical protein
MLVYLTTNTNKSIAINTKHVIMVEDSVKQGCVKIILVDGGTTEVQGNMLEIVAQLNNPGY